MVTAPMTLTVYDPETDERLSELSRVFIPTGIFTEVVHLAKGIDLEHPENLDEDAVEAIYCLVVEIFGEKISLDQVKQGTDLIEVLALIRNIMARVNSAMPAGSAPAPNPTRPGGARRRH